MRCTLGRVAELTGGELHGPADLGLAGVAIDSRQVPAGGLFVALRGERADGHLFAEAACAAGAAAVLASRPVPVPHVLVGDPVAALAALAADHRDGLDATVTGITGSSGKTGTKDVLASVLEEQGPTVAPPGSYNNDLGLPLTVLGAAPDTRHLVLEMGTRAAGDIARLCAVARPHTAVVLNIGSAHLGEFGSREAIAAAKSELVAGASRLAVLNADDRLVAAMAGLAPGQVRTFGDAGQVRAEQVRLDETGRPAYRLVADEGSAPVRLRLVGEHQVPNTLAAATAALSYGLPVEQVADALSRAAPRSRWRMEVVERPDGVTVVNDAYNANPESVRAALKALAAMTRGNGRRSWAVLGEMLELGDGSAAEHDAIGRLAVRLDVQRLVAVGEGARPIHLGASHEGSWGQESVWVPDVAAAAALLAAELRPGDVVLVKASRGAGLDRVAAAMLENAEVPTGNEPPR